MHLPGGLNKSLLRFTPDTEVAVMGGSSTPMRPLWKTPSGPSTLEFSLAPRADRITLSFPHTRVPLVLLIPTQGIFWDAGLYTRPTYSSAVLEHSWTQPTNQITVFRAKVWGVQSQLGHTERKEPPGRRTFYRGRGPTDGSQKSVKDRPLRQTPTPQPPSVLSEDNALPWTGRFPRKVKAHE